MIFAACAVNYIDQRNGGPAVQVANVLGGNASNDDKNVRHMELIFCLYYHRLHLSLIYI